MHSKNPVNPVAAAGGKTAAVQLCAHAANAPLLRFNMTPHATVADFVGQLEPCGGSFKYCLGPFVRSRGTPTCSLPPLRLLCLFQIHCLGPFVRSRGTRNRAPPPLLYEKCVRNGMNGMHGGTVYHGQRA